MDSFLFIPFYAIPGFVMTALMAWLYNVICLGRGTLALVRDIGEALSPYLAGGVLALPIEAHLASAQKGL